MTTKKVLFFSLVKKEYANLNTSPATVCSDIFNFIMNLPPVARQYDLTSAKFCRIEEVRGGVIQKMVFKSATHKYRAPLIDRGTGSERDNPKTITEGERVKTHMVIKYKSDEVLLCMEVGVGALNIKQFISCVEMYAKHYHLAKGTNKDYWIDYEILVKENFLEELRKLDRVMEGELYINKRVLGSETLNYSNRIEQVKHEIKMVIKAERGNSVKATLVDIFNKFSGGRSSINKIRIRGKNENDNNVILDTELIARTEFVEVEIHEDTGEVNSANILTQLKKIIENL